MNVKICGITRIQDAELSLKLGASVVGLIFSPSPRRITVQDAKNITSRLPPKSAVGVFVDEPVLTVLETAHTLDLQGVQLHGSEDSEYLSEIKRQSPALTIIKTIKLKANEEVCHEFNDVRDYTLYDSCGSHFDPNTRKPLEGRIISPKPFFLAGGVNPSNIHHLIQLHRPYGVDLSSGVESSPGIKDAHLLQLFFTNLKEALCKQL